MSPFLVPRLAWKQVLYLVHRWTGIGLCLLFAMWFLTGMVMMYVPFPNLDPVERYAGLKPIDGEQVRVKPGVAFTAAGVESPPQRMRMTTVLGRPAFHVLPQSGGWITVFADTGERIQSINAGEAIDSVIRFRGGHQAAHRERLDLDQWTVSGGLRPYLPLHRVALGDTAGTEFYVSDRTGEVVRDTNYNERLWNWLGANLHWIYPLELVRHRAVWHEVVVWLSIAGTLLAVTGVVAGLLRWRFRKRYKNGSGSPYQGWMRWHHWLGLASSIFVMTWIFSGLMSMNPWGIFPPKTPPAEDITRHRGGDLIAADFVSDLGETLRKQEEPVYEVELQRSGGRPYYVFRSGPLQSMTYAADLTAPGFARFTEKELLERAASLLPSARIAQADWLTDYDAYWYARENLGRIRVLPALRVRFDDADATWFHIDPATGQVLDRLTRANRVQRWLYNGLHSLDIGILLRNRPAWDIVVIALSLAGLVLSITGVVVAWQRLRRRSPTNRNRRRKSGTAKYKRQPHAPDHLAGKSAIDPLNS
jgi:uncharacterized iron-regulated membrane protein